MTATRCIHDLVADWCAYCTGTDDPTIPGPQPGPASHEYDSLENE